MAGHPRRSQQLGMRLSLLTDNSAETWAGALPAKWCIKDKAESAAQASPGLELADRLGSGARSEA